MKCFENIYYFYGSTKINPNQFLQELFSKEQESENTKAETKSSDIIIDLNQEHDFSFQYKKHNYKCTYYCKNVDVEKEVFKVSISLKYDSNKEQAAHAFSQLIRTIQQCKKGNFNMIPVKDELSTYYSERLYGKLAFYERSLRALITAIFIPVYKESWPQELTPSIGQDILKKKSKKERLEKALEELDLYQLELIFFDDELSINKNNYDEEFEVNNIETLSRDQLINKIRQNRPLSLWDQEISKYVSIDQAADRMKDIRDLRNRIAHNKTFTDKNYYALKRELNYIIPKINAAEDKILNEHNRKITFQTIQRTGEKFAEMAKVFSSTYLDTFEQIGKIAKQFQEGIAAARIEPLIALGQKMQKFAEVYPTDAINENNDKGENDSGG
ncbi:Swt1 family HEPN domain-containing protein [Gracilibacillus thailandensis]|uniref:Swt1-like HEPN domain-containing protein n=1 Tax=Gracilibacillus thailandensis TaxID=563735 RepID=A0A6N7R642_9BACI|nr:Swt1 family HEPN domain-containing protein [Gracilibacillus thailandensis]MRI68646.1 hypothetical protein [Gracilibacillus thailandensis]